MAKSKFHLSEKRKKSSTLNESEITLFVLVLPSEYNFKVSFLVKGNK